MRTITRSAVAGLIGALAFATMALSEEPVDHFADLGNWSMRPAEGGGSWQARNGFAIGEGHAWLNYAGREAAAPKWRDLEVVFALRLEPGSRLHINQRNGADRVFASLVLDETLRVGLHRGHPGHPVLAEASTGLDGEFYAVRFISGGDRYELNTFALNSEEVGSPAVLPEDWADFPTFSVSIEEGPDAGEFALEVVSGRVHVAYVLLSGDPIIPPPPPPPPAGWDLAIFRPTVRAVDSTTIEINATVVNFGPAQAPGGVLAAEFQGVPLGERSIAAGLEPNDETPIAWTVVVPDNLEGSAGALELALRLPEDDQGADNNVWQTIVDLPDRAAPPPGPPNGNGIPPWVPPTVIVSVVAGGGTWAVKRRAWQRKQARQARPDGPEGRCEPGEKCTTHDLDPDLKARKITGVVLSRREGDETLTATLDSDQVLGPLNRALWASRAMQSDRSAERTLEAANSLADEINEWLTPPATGTVVSVAASYEGSSGTATLKHFTCSSQGRWPDFTQAAPERTWKGTVTDKATIPLGELVVAERRAMVEQLARVLTMLVHRVCELRSPIPAGVDTELEVRL